MAFASVEKLYELCDVLDNASDKSQCVNEYTSILSGVKGGVNEKRLSAQLIVRYFNNFVDLRDQALEALFELCEDDDVNIRKSVIRDLPSLCKESGTHVAKIADVLVQLLQTEDNHEHQIVNSALSTLLANHPKDALATLFGHILNPDGDLIRERAVKFVTVKLKTLSATVITKEVEEYVLQQSKKVLPEASGDEFILFMHMLSQLRHLQTVQGRQLLLDIVTEQADLDKPFDPDDPDRLDQVIQCIKQALPFMSKNVHSTKFLTFLIDCVVPVLDKISAEASQLELLRLLAELAMFCGELPNMDAKLEIIETRLLAYLPIPPSQSGEDAIAENDSDAEPKMQFSEIECLVFTLHQLGKRHPSYLTSSERGEQLKELRKRLQYLGRVVQVYAKRLRESLLGKTKEQLKDEENRIKLIALRMTVNISALLKDLLHLPPSYKGNVNLSWKPAQPAPVDASQKRSSSTEQSEPVKRPSRQDAAIYQPPSGKFSEKVTTFQTNRGGFRGRGRARGTFRGRRNYY